MDALDQDSYEVQSWESLLEFAKKTNQKVKFFKKLNDHMLVLNKSDKAAIDRHVRKREREIKADEMREGSRKEKT